MQDSTTISISFAILVEVPDRRRTRKMRVIISMVDTTVVANVNEKYGIDQLMVSTLQTLSADGVVTVC